jgi:hypothetical protein
MAAKFLSSYNIMVTLGNRRVNSIFLQKVRAELDEKRT